MYGYYITLLYGVEANLTWNYIKWLKSAKISLI